MQERDSSSLRDKKSFINPQITQINADDSGAVILRAKPEACPERSEGTL